MNDEFGDDSYTTAATIEVGMRDNGQGITANEKSPMDNDHTNHQQEGTSRAQITETSPVQLKTHIQIPLLTSPAAPAQGRKRREVGRVADCSEGSTEPECMRKRRSLDDDGCPEGSTKPECKKKRRSIDDNDCP